MKTFEIWVHPTFDTTLKPQHVVQADAFFYRDGAYWFVTEKGTNVHAIVATPGMLVRTATK